MIREELITKLIQGKKTLDIGSLGQSEEYCLWPLLAQHSGSLTGVDLPNAESIALEKIKITQNGLSHKNDSRIVLGDMEEIELNEKFEIAIAGDVIEHVSNPGKFLDNIHHHLEESGLLIITTPNSKWPTVLLKPNPTHVLWHDIYTLEQLLTRHNFKIREAKYYYGNKPHYPFWKRALLARQQLFVVAEKTDPSTMNSH